MTQKSRAAIKAKFLSGEIPTQSDFGDLIDSSLSVIEDSGNWYTKDESDATTTELTNSLAAYPAASDIYTMEQTDARIQAIVGAAPTALDTLQQIGAQLSVDETAEAAIVTALSTKVGTDGTGMPSNVTVMGNTFNNASQLLKIGSDGKLPVLDGSNLTNVAMPTPIIDSTLAFTNNTTGDVSTTNHGFVPRAPGDGTQFLSGTGAWAAGVPGPAGVGMMVTSSTSNTANLGEKSFVTNTPHGFLIGVRVRAQSSLHQQNSIDGTVVSAPDAYHFTADFDHGGGDSFFPGPFIAWNIAALGLVGQQGTQGMQGPQGVAGDNTSHTLSGIIWTTRFMASPMIWSDLVWNGSMYCLIAGAGAVQTNLVYTAPAANGYWSQYNLPSNQYWRSVAWNGSVFCAISGGPGASNVAATSPDGVTWATHNLPATADWTSIAAVGGVFCAVSGYTSTSTIAATSPDGITWTQQVLPVAGEWSISGGTRFIAVSNNSTAVISSWDGVTWATASLPLSAYWSAVVYGMGRAIAIIGNGGASDQCAVSSDGGSNWFQHTLPAVAYWTAISCNGTCFCAIGTTAAGASVAVTSVDGIHWTSRQMSVNAPWAALTNNGAVFVAIAGGDTSAATDVLATSFDGP
jgi:hypothetical protein